MSASFIVRGKLKKRDMGSNNKLKNKSRQILRSILKFYFCKKEDHYRNECSLRKGENIEKPKFGINSESNLV